MDGSELFDTTRAKRPPKKKPAAQPSPLAHLMFAVYRSEYQQRFGTFPAPPAARDWMVLKRLVANADEATVEQFIRAYVAWDDPWVTKCGHTLGILSVKWNEVGALIRATQQQRGAVPQCQHEPKCPTAAAHSAAMIAALKATTTASSPESSHILSKLRSPF
jgi:hypothetical protein